jgi:heme exporter protein C
MDLAQFVDVFLHLDKHLEAVVAQYGAWVYALLFAIIFVETGLVVMPFLPGDSLLFVCGALAAIGARAIALPGAFFSALCLATGSLWGRPAWGTWWVWDGRLTSMLVLLFLYLAYIALAEAADRDSQGSGQSRIPAIFGLVGAINIPIIHYSVLWWNSLHQPPSIAVGKSAMAPVFLYGLLAASLGFSLIFGGVVLARMRAILANSQAEARLRRKAMELEDA